MSSFTQNNYILNLSNNLLSLSNNDHLVKKIQMCVD